MAPATVGRVLEGIARRLPLEEDCEVTLEANPGTIDERRLQGFRAAGVNRLSIGVQSFSDERLARLGRIHSAREAREAVAAATRTFENLNLDLMYALPGETPEDLALELREAAASGATHLSCYQLTIEPGTAFARRVPEDLPDEDVTAGMGDLVESLLAERGFGRYEVSGYAQPGRRCRHNLNYWTFGDYLAAGAGAHGKLSTPEGVRRETRAAAPAKYLRSVAAGSPAEDAHVVPAEDLPFEFMLNALRLLDGVPARLFTERTDLPLSVIEERLAALRERPSRSRSRAHPPDAPGARLSLGPSGSLPLKHSGPASVRRQACGASGRTAVHHKSASDARLPGMHACSASRPAQGIIPLMKTPSASGRDTGSRIWHAPCL